MLGADHTDDGLEHPREADEALVDRDVHRARLERAERELLPDLQKALGVSVDKIGTPKKSSGRYIASKSVLLTLYGI